jgi:hypothetical protein
MLDILNVGSNYNFKWPGGDIEKFDFTIIYKALSDAGNHKITIGYGYRNTYGKDRRRVVVWIDDYPRAEFLAADDFDITGEILSEIRFYDDEGESKRMCRYASDAIPQRYSMFRVDSLKRRVSGDGVHDAWAIVANISDHITMSALAGMRKYEIEG